jgi:Family of unknown function (DUF6272)/SiaC family regulatory phosphoprotein
MSQSGVFLEYRGLLDFSVIDSLLIKLKKTGEYIALNKTTAKRVYSMVVECLENISKHAALKAADNPTMYSHISVRMDNDKIIIVCGNPVVDEAKENISARIDFINSSDEETLKAQYKKRIKSDIISDDRCAGLGFIYMALKSGNKLSYSFIPLDDGYSYFEIRITQNKFIMKKLIIDQKSNSPKVILDPEKKIFLIEGESRPPVVSEFYGQIIEWLECYGTYLINENNQNDSAAFNFNFEYFNSSSGKQILDICKVLAGLRSKGFNISVNWHFEKDDYDMLEAGKEMSRIVKFPFEYVESDMK